MSALSQLTSRVKQVAKSDNGGRCGNNDPKPSCDTAQACLMDFSMPKPSATRQPASSTRQRVVCLLTLLLYLTATVGIQVGAGCSSLGCRCGDSCAEGNGCCCAKKQAATGGCCSTQTAAAGCCSTSTETKPESTPASCCSQKSQAGTETPFVSSVCTCGSQHPSGLVLNSDPRLLTKVTTLTGVIAIHPVLPLAGSGYLSWTTAPESPPPEAV